MQAAPVTQTVKSKKKSKREQEEAAIQQARQAAEAAALAGVSVQVRRALCSAVAWSGRLLTQRAWRVSACRCAGRLPCSALQRAQQAAGAAAMAGISQQVGSQKVILQYCAVPLSRRLLRWQSWQVPLYR